MGSGQEHEEDRGREEGAEGVHAGSWGSSYAPRSLGVTEGS